MEMLTLPPTRHGIRYTFKNDKGSRINVTATELGDTDNNRGRNARTKLR